jgi:hypothetical protein
MIEFKTIIFFIAPAVLFGALGICDFFLLLMIKEAVEKAEKHPLDDLTFYGDRGFIAIKKYRKLCPNGPYLKWHWILVGAQVTTFLGLTLYLFVIH